MASLDALPVEDRPFLAGSDGNSFFIIPVSYFRYRGVIDTSNDDSKFAEYLEFGLKHSEAVFGTRASTKEDLWAIRWRINEDCTIETVRSLVVS